MPKVLVVDDSLSVRKVVEKALEGRGLQVLAAASGAEAILMIDRDRPDVVICDVILPDKDGYQICQYVRTHPAIGATPMAGWVRDRKSTRLNSSHVAISYAVFCLKKKKQKKETNKAGRTRGRWMKHDRVTRTRLCRNPPR